MNAPKQRALKRINYILDAVEELRHSNPSGQNNFMTYADKLAYGAITLREFRNLLNKIESEGLAKFIHHTNGHGGGWGEEPVEIRNVNWTRFDKYYKEIKNELKDETPGKKLTFNRLSKWVRIITDNKVLTIISIIVTVLGILVVLINL